MRVLGGLLTSSSAAIVLQLQLLSLLSCCIQEVQASLFKSTITSPFKSNPRTFNVNSVNVNANPLLIPRGGSSLKTASPSATADLQKYRMQQSHLLQLKSTFLSEALASRGISIGPTLMDVSTPEGSKPPQETDWDCSLSTPQNPKSCLYSFDAEPYTKVICPTGTQQYISLKALNRLRRTDPSKVEPMWHSQYAILKSWFGSDSDSSQFSLLQFVGYKGFLVTNILLDLGRGAFLKGLLAFGCLIALLTVMPLVEIVGSRILVCSPLWMKWMSWGRFVHAALPLKILLGQMAWKFVAGSFGKLEGFVRDYIVELECQILEDCIPITTVGDDDSGEGEGDIDSCGIDDDDDLFMAQGESDNGADEEEYLDASSLQYDESEHESEEVYDSSESEEDY